MAPTATTRRPALGRLSLGKAGKGKAGPQPVGGSKAANGRRQKPNRLLLGVLGLVAVAAVGRVAMPGMFGGGSRAVAPLSAPLTDRHLLRRAPTTTVPGGGTATTVARPSRDPFTPPPGFGS